MGKKKADPSAAIAGAAAGQSKEAMEYAKRQLEGKEPTLEELAIKEFEKYQLAGELSPEQVVKSRFEAISEDPRYLRSKMAALADIEKRSKMGLSPEELSRIADLREQALGDERAQQASLLQEMAARGSMDSGAQLAAQLAGSQQGAQRRLQQARQNAADINTARQQAMGQLAQTAQGFSQADLQRQQAQAQAMDAQSQWNAQQRYDAAVRNLGTKQNVMGQNTALENQRRLQNIDARQQQYQNLLSKTGAVTGAQQAYSNALFNQAGMAGKAGPSKLASAFGGAATGAGAMAATGNPYAIAAGAGVGALGGMFAAKDGAIVPSFAGGGYTSNRASLDEQDYLRRRQLGNTQDQYAEINQANRPIPTNSSNLAELSGANQDEAARIKQEDLTKGATPLAESSPNDQIASQAETNAAIKSEQAKSDASTAQGITGALGGLSSILGGGKSEESAPRSPGLSVKSSFDQPESILGAKGSMSSRYADILKAPQFQNGGFLHAEDGAVEHDGSGDVVPGESYAGDKVDARVNSGEMVLNLEQQERLNQLLQDYKRLKTGKRVDEQVDQGHKQVNEGQQEALMGVLKGESDVTELPENSVLDEMSLDQLKKLMLMLGDE